MIFKVISGGQSGADLGGLLAAIFCNIPCGGCISKNFRTEYGNRPEYKQLFNLVEHNSTNYQARTFDNVKNSDGTVRFIYNFNSTGEKCTANAIQKYKKPFFDINLHSYCRNGILSHRVIHKKHIIQFENWLFENNIAILNVAGHRESSLPGIGCYTFKFIALILKRQGKINDLQL